MNYAKKLKYILLIWVLLVLAVMTSSCGSVSYDTYTLNNQLTTDYPSGWIVDTWEASPSTVRFMLPSGDPSRAHVRIFVIVEEEAWPSDDYGIVPTVLDNGTEYVGVYTQDPDVGDELIFFVKIDTTEVNVQAFIPPESSFKASTMQDYCKHMIASMRVP